MKKYPAPAEAIKPEHAPQPSAQVIEFPAMSEAAIALVTSANLQSETTERLAQLIETMAAQKGKTVRVKILRDTRTGNMSELVITSGVE